MKRIIFISVVIMASVSFAKAQDRIFTYTYQSNVLSPQEREIEVWNTFGTGRQDFYRGYENKIEFETGIAKNLQAAFYFKVKATTGYNMSNDSSMSSSTSIAFSNEWKYKLSDPVANAIGSALYTELELSQDGVETENKIILDKKLGRNTFALNLVGTYEVVKTTAGKLLKNEKEFKAEFDFGYAYYLGKGFNLGLEAQSLSKHEYGEWKYSALYAGPVLSYSRDKFWINLTVMPQITAFKGATYKNLVLDDQQKLNTRLVFSFAL